MHRSVFHWLAATLFLLVLAACASNEAPQGRWEGVSESANWLVAVRLQVDPGNVIHASALSIRVTDVSLSERLSLAEKIRATMPGQWPQAVRSKVDFSNNVLKKAGGFAPLFVYDPKSRSMTFNFYADGKLSEHVKLHPVKNFMVTG